MEAPLKGRCSPSPFFRSLGAQTAETPIAVKQFRKARPIVDMANRAGKNTVGAEIHATGNVAGYAAEAGIERGHPVQIIPIPARKAIGAASRAAKGGRDTCVRAAQNVEHKPL